MKYLINAFWGFCMSLADSVPGVSGGTIAFILGFYDKFINEKNKFNYFNFRLIASFMKSYLKEPEIITDRKEVYGQTLLDDILLEELRSNYEQMKIDLMEGIVPKRDLK